MSSDSVLLIAGIFAEAVFAALLTFKRAARSLPVFYAYIVWSLVVDSGMLFLSNRFPSVYLRIFVVELSLDTLFQYSVLVELAASILRPFRSQLPRRILIACAVSVLVLCAAAWSATTVPGAVRQTTLWIDVARLAQAFAYVRILFFLALAACSHLLSIGWRDREVQVASGLGFYSLCSLVVSLLHAHQQYNESVFHLLDLFVGLSYLAVLIYWIVCFSRPAPPRRTLPPTMRRLLRVVSGAAHDQRIALKPPTPPGDRNTP